MSDRVCHGSRLGRHIQLWTLCVSLSALCAMSQTTASKKTSVASGERSPEAVLAQVGSSVYIVEAISEHGDVVAQQSGVAISRNTIVATRNLIGTFASPKSGQRAYVARYRIRQGRQLWGVSNVYVDLHRDVARFESVDLSAVPATAAPDTRASAETAVCAISYPNDQSEAVAKGRLLPVGNSADHEGLLPVSFQVNEESAGGGVFNGRGALIGFLTVDPITGRTAVAPIAWSRDATLIYSGTPLSPATPDKSKEDLWRQAQTLGYNLQTFSSGSLAHKGKTVSLLGGSEDQNPEIMGLQNARLMSLFDQHAPETFENWPRWRKALASMEELRLEMNAAEESGAAEGSDAGASIVRRVLADGRKLWSEISDVFCAEVPGAPLMDLDGRKRECLR